MTMQRVGSAHVNLCALHPDRWLWSQCATLEKPSFEWGRKSVLSWSYRPNTCRKLAGNFALLDQTVQLKRLANLNKSEWTHSGRCATGRPASPASPPPCTGPGSSWWARRRVSRASWRWRSPGAGRRRTGAPSTGWTARLEEREYNDAFSDAHLKCNTEGIKQITDQSRVKRQKSSYNLMHLPQTSLDLTRPTFFETAVKAACLKLLFRNSRYTLVTAGLGENNQHGVISWYFVCINSQMPSFNSVEHKFMINVANTSLFVYKNTKI